MSTDIDYYELLEVQRGADDATLKSSYRRLAMRWHPDKNPGDTAAEQRFKAISEAYDCLKDAQKRAAYDRYGHAAYTQQASGGGAGPQDFGGFSDIFENIFGEFMGGGGGRQRRSGPARGQDLRYDLELNLEEAFVGKAASLEVETAVNCEPCGGTGAKPGTSARTCTTCQGQGRVGMRQGLFMVERACPACHGTGQVIADPCDTCSGAGRVDKRRTLSVNIPRGVDDGTRIRVAGEGEAGARGGPSGDLYIFVHMKPHSFFKREGTTLFTTAPISITTAALGGEIEVPGLDRDAAVIKIPHGTQTGKQFRVRGRGMPALNGGVAGGGFGDLVVQIEVETPVKLTKRQRELLQEFQQLEAEEGGKNTPRQSGFFDKLRDAWNELTD
ncbi:chaperone protein DnaJ [Polymorphobacter multimanifer]|uniref:Chaperone protein DnaJ n=1 Tax=Polymorphobacter multimanifer TaxID=1070431 RepID=A0A841L1C7_9SPHN|nr:molecular chaperone DnaJ [Polymorphobacter multimanifer]MBB6226220.1 molecular chaperone DnaJ [Polymorphobacter multimanifer]GGI79620.1 chaperone protein DnaJ [Polymorphobacter multimanifer]